MLEKSYLHQNGVELNFLFIGLASRPFISLRINPRIREDSKGVRTAAAAGHSACSRIFILYEDPRKLGSIQRLVISCDATGHL